MNAGCFCKGHSETMTKSLNLNTNNNKSKSSKLHKYVDGLKDLMDNFENSISSKEKRESRKNIIHLDARCPRFNKSNFSSRSASSESSKSESSSSDGSRSDTSFECRSSNRKNESTCDSSTSIDSIEEEEILRTIKRLYDKVKKSKRKKSRRRRSHSSRRSSTSRVNDNNYARKLAYEIEVDKYRKFEHKHDKSSDKVIDIKNDKKYKALMASKIRSDDKNLQKLPGIGQTYEAKLQNGDKPRVRTIQQLLKACDRMKKCDFKCLMRYYCNMNSHHSEKVYLTCKDYIEKRGLS